MHIFRNIPQSTRFSPSNTISLFHQRGFSNCGMNIFGESIGPDMMVGKKAI